MPSITQNQENWCVNAIRLVAVVAMTVEYLVEGDSPPIPHLCDNVKCPPLSDLLCPSDSSIRELIAEPLIADKTKEEFHNNLQNVTEMTEITEKMFSQCCLIKKCICNLCYIPDCHNKGEVVVELVSESNDMPGFCCGKYECQKEPNCTEVEDTENNWLTNCQRCKCYGGHSLCHQNCDEGIKKPAMCHSKNSNTVYEHGQSWRKGCYDCECVNGVINCMVTFCKALNCPKSRQVQLKDSCCPVCWPEGFAMPNADIQYDEGLDSDQHNEIESAHKYDNPEDYSDNKEQIEPDVELKPINEAGQSLLTDNTTISFTAATTTTTAATSSTEKRTTTKPPVTLPAAIPTSANLSLPCKNDVLSNSTQEPSRRQDMPATYQIYPQVVELMRYSQHNNLLYTIIGCLSIIVVILVAWNIHLKAKQRSYRPVTNFDDNFNRMAPNIKKMNDYV